MNKNSAIRIRPATLNDKGFIISLLPRLVEFGPPPWRDAAAMLETDTQVVSEKLLDTHPQKAFFIAEDSHGIALGFIHLEPGKDYYNHGLHGHIANLIVSPDAEGHGVGQLLLEKAEEWARNQGFRWLTLSVFAQNRRARELYQR